MKSLVRLLMLADARLPAGGYAHSGGIEPAVAAGVVRDLADLAVFLRGRLRTAGAVAAGLTAVACREAAGPGHAVPGHAVPGHAVPGHAVPGHAVPGHAVPGHAVPDYVGSDPAGWAWLDAEADARMPSPAQRGASRQQGRALLRAARLAWPGAYLDELAATPGGPHHPIVLGVVAAAAGAEAGGAAQVAAYLSVSGPAAAAVRLCGFDPLAANAVLAGLAEEISTVAIAATGAAEAGELPCPAAPRLDVLAEAHVRGEVRLFAS